METKETQLKVSMKPVWEEKGFHFTCLVLGPLLFSVFGISVVYCLIGIMSFCGWLSETFRFLLSHLL